MTGMTLPASISSLTKARSFWSGFADKPSQFLNPGFRHQRAQKHSLEDLRHGSAGHDINPPRAQGTLVIRNRMIAVRSKNQVIGLPILSEYLCV
jgi:hypothetical protein